MKNEQKLITIETAAELDFCNTGTNLFIRRLNLDRSQSYTWEQIEHRLNSYGLHSDSLKCYTGEIRKLKKYALGTKPDRTREENIAIIKDYLSYGSLVMDDCGIVDLKLQTPSEHTLYVGIPFTSCGVYERDLVGEANQRYIRENYESLWDSTFITEHRGSLVWNASMLIELSDDTLEDCEEVDFLRDIASLEDWPLLDDEKHSELEEECLTEAWEDWIATEFAEKLVEKFSESSVLREAMEIPEDWDYIEAELEELLDNDYTALKELYCDCCDSEGLYEEVDGSGYVSIDLDQLVEACTAEDIIAKFIPNKGHHPGQMSLELVA